MADTIDAPALASTVNVISKYEIKLMPLIGILTAVAVIALAGYRLISRFQPSAATLRIAGTASSVGLLALLIAPTLWAGYSVINNTESSFPTAGPTAGNDFANGGFGGRGGFTGFEGGFGGGTLSQANSALISYIEVSIRRDVLEQSVSGVLQSRPDAMASGSSPLSPTHVRSTTK